MQSQIGRMGRYLSAEMKEVFFFEKKNQKTFAPAPWPPCAILRQRARQQTSKSFLVLFFKKEHFLFSRLLSSPLRRRYTAPPTTKA
jgi:hypothetical protein